MTESKFYAAFRQAQSEFRDPVKDGSNPHFKSRFVTLKGVLDAVRQILHRNGLCVFQCFETMENGQAVIRTELRADDGSGIASCVPVICAKQNDPQAFGSAATYARRYGIAAICGIAPADEDDDGEEAARPARAAPKPAAKVSLRCSWLRGGGADRSRQGQGGAAGCRQTYCGTPLHWRR
jgi:hypothetical protein